MTKHPMTKEARMMKTASRRDELVTGARFEILLSGLVILHMISLSH